MMISQAEKKGKIRRKLTKTNRYLRDLLFILALGALWAGSGYVIGRVGEAMGLDYPLGVIFASLNTILGMSLFLGITKDPTADRIFFEGPRPNEGGRWSIGCLWVMPVSLLILGLGMWVVAVVLRLIYE